MKKYVYIAGPFFNPQQLAVIEDIKSILSDIKIPYFSPKDECMYEPGKTTPAEILDMNIRALHETTLLVCVTDGKDPGTMFEAGYSYANDIPILYVWLSGTKEQKFNLVLAASGGVVRSLGLLREVLARYAIGEDIKIHVYDDEDIHYE